MPIQVIDTPLRRKFPEFAPLEAARAEELKRLINLASRNREAVVIDPDGPGITKTIPVDLIAPTEKVNVLVRYRRHYSVSNGQPVRK